MELGLSSGCTIHKRLSPSAWPCLQPTPAYPNACCPLLPLSIVPGGLSKFTNPLEPHGQIPFTGSCCCKMAQAIKALSNGLDAHTEPCQSHWPTLIPIRPGSVFSQDLFLNFLFFDRVRLVGLFSLWFLLFPAHPLHLLPLYTP
ncbi:hypothetical protein EJ08DRAFT_319390 [Tothia fuscella]|uniref:Uncharacterized protein n=1 Tax=Tothia fuscella TaxID=1048955 RepID=A0A9P4NNU7_9PEZI|nr:hypothetical protein EJ08DRAFT_319390 [Tothia fuscella]